MASTATIGRRCLGTVLPIVLRAVGTLCCALAGVALVWLAASGSEPPAPQPTRGRVRATNSEASRNIRRA